MRNRCTGHADDDDDHRLLLEIGALRADGEAPDGVRELLALPLPLRVSLHRVHHQGQKKKKQSQSKTEGRIPVGRSRAAAAAACLVLEVHLGGLALVGQVRVDVHRRTAAATRRAGGGQP